MSRQISDSKSSDVHCKLEEEYILGESLGKGGFGEVLKVRKKSDDHEYAMKIVRFKIDEDDVMKFDREVKMLAPLDHENVIRYYHSWIDSSIVPVEECEEIMSSEESIRLKIKKVESQICVPSSESSETSNCSDSEINYKKKNETTYPRDLLKPNTVEMRHLHILMELCEQKSLKEEIKNYLYLNEMKVFKYFHQICEGLAYIHRRNIMHRDLKPDNIFLKNDVIKIGDFGLSRHVNIEEIEDSLPFSTFYSKAFPFYKAPELHLSKNYNFKLDIYSLGAIYLEMCSRPMTFSEKYEYFPLSERGFGLLNRVVDIEKRNLMMKMLHSDPSNRPTSEDILNLLKPKKITENLRQMVDESNRNSQPHVERFERSLQSYDLLEIHYKSFCVKNAVKIFELHGAQNITMPIFLPSQKNGIESSTTLINMEGNSLFVTDNSRIAFCCYINSNKITDLRRYSIGNAFQDNSSWPIQFQECSFECVSSVKNDVFNDAEVLYIAKQVVANVFSHSIETEISGLKFHINHGNLISAIIRKLQLNRTDSLTFTNILKNAGNSKDLEIELSNKLNLNSSSMRALVSLWQPVDINTACKEYFKFVGRKYPPISTAVRYLTRVKKIASQFGITENILLAPLLISQTKYFGLMFKVVYNKTTIAIGNNFYNMLRKNKKISLSAIGISFRLNAMVDLLKVYRTEKSNLDVLIVSEPKYLAIPLLKQVWSHNLTCEVRTSDNNDSLIPPIKIRMLSENTIEVVFSWKGGIIHDGPWTDVEFSTILRRYRIFSGSGEL